MNLIRPHHVEQMQMVSAYLGRAIPCYFVDKAGTHETGKQMFNFCVHTAIITAILLRRFLRYHYEDEDFEVHAIEALFDSSGRQYNHAYVWIENKSPESSAYGFLIDYAKIDIQVGFRRSTKNDLSEFLVNPITQQRSTFVKEIMRYNLDERLSDANGEHFTKETTKTIVGEINALMTNLYRFLGLQPDVFYNESLRDVS